MKCQGLVRQVMFESLLLHGGWDRVAKEIFCKELNEMAKSAQKSHLSNLSTLWSGLVDQVAKKNFVAWNCVKFPYLHRKVMFDNLQYGEGWGPGQVPKINLVRNCMKCPDLLRWVMLDFIPMGVGAKLQVQTFFARIA